MFTGLIERLGRVKSHSSDHSTITIQVLRREELTKYQSSLNPDPTSTAAKDDQGVLEFFNDMKEGDSISVDGVCLTVVEFSVDESSFDLNLAPETLSRSNLGSLKVDDLVNVERALSPSTRFGGHFVQGHVDRTGTIVSKTKDGDSIRMTIEFEEDSCESSKDGGVEEGTTKKATEYSKFLIPKGYITIDGISLTITGIENRESIRPGTTLKNRSTRVSIMLIPHTQLNVTLSLKSVASTVNLEFDMLVKTIINVIEYSLSDQLDRIINQALRSQLAQLGIQPSSSSTQDPIPPQPLELD
ncbi:Riboflavin synthase alpha chain [Puccinia graminis f. sp. tritici]|uniref:Riboflavin synthase alpha chain n=1 Tax=Puccinia graminis f. sp. tritici TaxID=56615 RepID=A0A5B0LHU1_PUCGR|nr:Riboflavin synthase alpha chain [Puccinia graminis f. sp. tritici]KAA1092760.1 Riboflavin synthase alpha chain [Puccinia graminis f. sp. tritici]